MCFEAGGGQLSGGQKQRIALARALLKESVLAITLAATWFCSFAKDSLASSPKHVVRCQRAANRSSVPLKPHLDPFIEGESTVRPVIHSLVRRRPSSSWMRPRVHWTIPLRR